MNGLTALVFLVSLAGVAISYPMYFYELHLFGTRLKAHHPDAWARYSSVLASPGSRSHAAYKSLRNVRGGVLDGTPLHPEVRQSHVIATRLLYVGATCFLSLLLVGLADSLG